MEVMTSHTIRELPHNKNFQINETKLQKLKISGTFKSCDLKFLGKVLSQQKILKIFCAQKSFQEFFWKIKSKPFYTYMN